MMSRWMIRLGYCLLVIGGVLVSPLPDLLPVDTWGWLRGISSQREPAPYYRIVPAGDAWPVVWPTALMAAGLLLVAYGKLIGRTRGR